jgi:hypothetical protein
MRRYAQVSGAFFGLLATVQLTRTVLGWPIQVAGVWASACAFVITLLFAIWAFRTGKGAV